MNRPALRILHVTNMFPSSRTPAAGAFVATQVRSLARLGISQEVYVIRKGRYASAVGAVRDLAYQGRFDIVHAHYGLSGWVASWQQLPLVVTFAGSDLYGVRYGTLRMKIRGRVGVWASQWAAARADRVIVMSRRMLDLLWFRSLRDKTEVLPYGVETSRFQPIPGPIARAKLGLDPEAVLVFWPHNDSPLKRRDLAERATELAAQMLGRPVVLWAPPRVAHDQMPMRYHAADCLLLVSETEGSPTVVKEALSAGLPVVSVDVGDAWEWLADLAWCQRVSRDVESIARGIVAAVHTPRPERPPPCVHTFDADAIAERLLAIYQETV